MMAAVGRVRGPGREAYEARGRGRKGSAHPGCCRVGGAAECVPALGAAAAGWDVERDEAGFARGRKLRYRQNTAFAFHLNPEDEEDGDDPSKGMA